MGKNIKELRFGFGENWIDFENSGVSTKEIDDARRSLRLWTDEKDLTGKKFLDIGNGSGLFSLAAWEMGAEKVTSFDFDEKCVECAKKMSKRAVRVPSANWVIEQGSVLDQDYMKQFYAQYDIVYSWGVLHHTGNMKKALEQAGRCVKENGLLFISIYNDQGRKSQIWEKVKKIYNKVGKHRQRMLITLSSLYLYGLKHTMEILRSNRTKRIKTLRGMNEYTDLIDWVGGYPFEYATPEKIISFYLCRGFELRKLSASGKDWAGCNQFLFVKKSVSM